MQECSRKWASDPWLYMHHYNRMWSIYKYLTIYIYIYIENFMCIYIYIHMYKTSRDI